jgi:hypothetical protein
MSAMSAAAAAAAAPAGPYDNSLQQPERRIIVGLDFGTYASGFAYSTDGGHSVRMFTSYPDQSTPYPKALTAILYEDGEPVQWGWTACKDFMALSQEDRWVASMAKS